MPPTYGIIVPVRNEAALLPATVRKLLEATAGDQARIIWVCNGCDDDSAAVIRQHAGPGAEVIELAEPGKTGALQAGDDALGDLFPRVYLDADTWLRPGDLDRLLAPLLAGAADLVAPRLRLDSTGASWLSARIGDCWLALPHARTTAFSNAIGLSGAGRARWGRWPRITGDDIFVAATIPADRKRIVPEALATTGMPRDFRGWVRMRARWRKGERELAELGLSPPQAPGQKAALLRRMRTPRLALGAWAFAAARVLASRGSEKTGSGIWLPDRARNRKRNPGS
jgi:glycosyltransferase involved in cell wall biosynthesis